MSDFFDDGLDKVRSIAYHEFGHHLHQMKYVNNDINYGAFKKTGFRPKVEVEIEKIFNEDRLNIANSVYGSTNSREFFAEQFSAYSMGKTEAVHPKILKLIKELEDDVAR